MDLSLSYFILISFLEEPYVHHFPLKFLISRHRSTTENPPHRFDHRPDSIATRLTWWPRFFNNFECNRTKHRRSRRIARTKIVDEMEGANICRKINPRFDEYYPRINGFPLESFDKLLSPGQRDWLFILLERRARKAADTELSSSVYVLSVVFDTNLNENVPGKPRPDTYHR